MTKKENKKCEQLMYEAIREIKDSKEIYKTYKCLLEQGRNIESELKLMAAREKIGYARGINQSLEIIGFKHEDMKQLSELL